MLGGVWVLADYNPRRAGILPSGLHHDMGSAHTETLALALGKPEGEVWWVVLLPALSPQFTF